MDTPLQVIQVQFSHTQTVTSEPPVVIRNDQEFVAPHSLTQVLEPNTESSSLQSSEPSQKLPCSKIEK